MDLPQFVGSVAKNNTEEIRVNLQTFKGHDICDVRVFGKFSAAALFMPTAKGVSVNVAKLPDLIAVLKNAEAKAKDLGLIPKRAD